LARHATGSATALFKGLGARDVYRGSEPLDWVDVLVDVLGMLKYYVNY